MRKLIIVLLIINLTSILFAACAVEPTVMREQTNVAVIEAVSQNAYGDVYVDVSGISEVAAGISVGYAIGDAAPSSWQSYSVGVPAIYFAEINANVGSVINLYIKLDEYSADDGVQYKESAPSAPYSYKIKDVYDADSKWYRSKTTFMETYSTDGVILRDIAQSGLYGPEIDCWAYTVDEETRLFYDNIYYLNAAGLSLILKKLTITQSGESYYYTLLDPDITYEYALSESHNQVWYPYSSLTGIIFGDADWIFLRISGNEDNCESIAFIYFDVQRMIGGND